MSADTTHRLNGHAILAPNVEDETSLGERMLIPCSKALITRIQDYRFANRIDSKSAAIRRLLEIALNAEAEKNRRRAL